MNMISTGAFLDGMDASEKQETIVKKFARVWEKKNSKTARAGGVSLMALSLAACGSDDDTTTTTTTTDTTTTTVVTPAGKVFGMKSTGDVISPNATTAATTSGAGDDHARAATTGDFTSADMVDLGDGADKLTANVTEGTANNAVTIQPMLTSVETVKITMTAVANDTTTTLNLSESTGVDSVEIVVANDADNTVSGITNATTVTWTGVGAADTVATVTLTAASLSAATDGGADTYTTNLNNADLDDLAIAGVETITLGLSGKDVDVADLSADALEALIITGGVEDTTVTTENAHIGSGTAVDFAGIDVGEVALIDASASTNKVNVTTNDDTGLTIIGGAGQLTVDNTNDGGGGDQSNMAVTATAGAGGLAVTLQGGGNAATATAMNLVTVTGSDAKDTVNIASVPNPTDITATSANEARTVNATVDTGAGADTVTVNAGVVDVKTGAGDDTLVVTTTGNITGGTNAAVDLIDLGDGTDTISTADATINASDKTWVSYIKNSESIRTTATGEKTIDLDLLANTNIVSASLVATHAASAQAAAADVGGSGATGTGSTGADALDFTGSNANSTLSLTTDLVGQQGQGCSAAADDAGDTGGAGGVGLDLNVTVDNGNNTATITLVDDADITGGAGGEGSHANSTGGTGGIGLDASQVDNLNIILSATDTTADAVAIAGGAAGTAGSGTAGTAGGDISVAANGTITLTETMSGTATLATHVSSINLNNIVGSNVTVDASALTGAVTIDSTQGNTTITLGSGADTYTGTEGGIDTVNLGAGNDTMTHTGGGVDVITLGAGNDTIKVAAAYDNSTDAMKITDFARGAGGDVISIDVSEVDGATADLVDNLDISGGLYVEGTVGTVTSNDSATAFASNSINVMLGSSFATYAKAEAELAVEAGGALTDIAVVFLNSTSGVAEMYLSDTTANATNDFLLATFSDITTLDQLAELAAGNFTEF